MYVVITIAGDPVSWWTESVTDAAELAAELAQGPADVPVIDPLKGNLLISAKASVAIVQVPPSQSWIPSGTQAPVATLYVQAGPTAGSSGYTLPVGTDLADLRNQIRAAMAAGSVIKVPVSSDAGNGIAVLNGGTLTFAVVCPPPS
ncbi:MAG TPA: hypothetical protein VN695_03955 [Streptosporangiaceae bacterium]|nr:hypothetical protein [Streptosporangiaceae bacterium]